VWAILNMSRLTASWLLIVLLVGVSAPAAAALNPEPPHACCLRKTPHCHHSSSESQRSISSRACAQHSCCKSLGGGLQWAPADSAAILALIAPSGVTVRSLEVVSISAASFSSTSVRAPPQV
jgi:hypothetical protein